MSGRIPVFATCLTVLLPEPVGPMTLNDIELGTSPLRVESRTRSRYHLVPDPLCSPSQVVLREGAPSQEVPRLPAEILGLSDGADRALCLSEVVDP